MNTVPRLLEKRSCPTMPVHAVPTQPFDNDFLDFIRHFYETSDVNDRDFDVKYAECFVSEGILVMPAKRAVGAREIIALREGAWGDISTREHTVLGIVPFRPHASDVLLWGTVKYGMKDGSTKESDWAAKGSFVRVDGAVKWKDYKVYTNSAPK